jgi:tetratricopeptide (TPR) repeat protein
LIALLLLTAWGCSALVQMRVDEARVSYRDSPEMLWFSSGKAIRALSLGHQALFANIYWTRAVQYYGSRLRDRKMDFSLLRPLLDITVTLDPKLMEPYYIGSIFLSERPPRGPGDPQAAIDLLQRGIAANPDEWRLWHHLGFIYYWELQDYEKAADAYSEGAKNPNARDWMRVMAASINLKGGNRETSLFLWSEIYQSTEDPTIRANAERHIYGLRAQGAIGEIENLAQQFREQFGRWPNTMGEMVSQGLLPGIPLDPAGYPYRLQPNGEVELDPASTVELNFDRAPTPPAATTP